MRVTPAILALATAALAGGSAQAARKPIPLLTHSDAIVGASNYARVTFGGARNTRCRRIFDRSYAECETQLPPDPENGFVWIIPVDVWRTNSMWIRAVGTSIDAPAVPLRRPERKPVRR